MPEGEHAQTTSGQFNQIPLPSVSHSDEEESAVEQEPENRDIIGGMEVFSWGQRNILDVCIDPYMNLFTRDNTNDGGGWDIRVSHVLQSGNYGYPSLYKNFTDEMLPPEIGTDERRLQVRAYNFWASLLDERNLPHVDVRDVQGSDPVSLIAYEKVLVTVSAVKKFEELLG